MNKAISSFLAWTDASGQNHTFYPDLVISEKWEEDATGTEHPVEQGADVIDHVRVELIRCELTIFSTNEPIGPNNFDDPGQPQNVSISGENSPNQEGTANQDQSVTAQVWNAELAAKGALLALGGGAGSALGGTTGNVIGAAVGAAAGAFLLGHEVDTPTSIVAGVPGAPTVTGTANIFMFANAQDYVAATIQLLTGLKNSAQIITLNGSKQTIQSMFIETLSYSREQDTGTGAEIVIGLKELRLVQTQFVTAPLPSVPRAMTPVKKGGQDNQDGSDQQQESVATALAAGGKKVISNVASFLGF